MKLKYEELLSFRCDRCGAYKTRKDMYDDNICGICFMNPHIKR